MSADFDPYSEWLKIASLERPPNHYDLLGVEVFEERQEELETAFQDRYALVRKYQVGEHADLALALLQSLGKSHECLTNRGKKKKYDETLRRKLAKRKKKSSEASQYWILNPEKGTRLGPFSSRQLAALIDRRELLGHQLIEKSTWKSPREAEVVFPKFFEKQLAEKPTKLPPPLTAPLSFDEELEQPWSDSDPLGIEEPDFELESQALSPHTYNNGLVRLLHRLSRRSTIVLLGGATLVLVAVTAVVVTLIAILAYSNDGTRSNRRTSQFAQRRQGQNPQQGWDARRQADLARQRVIDRTLGGRDGSTSEISSRVNKGEMDIFPLLTFHNEKRQIGWRLSGRSLFTPEKGNSSIRMTFPGQRYQLSMQVRRISGDNALFVVVPVKQCSVVAVTDGYDGATSGLSRIGGLPFHMNSTSVSRRLFDDDQFHQVQIFVTETSVMFYFDESRIYRWQGDSRELTPDPKYGDERRSMTLYIGSVDSSFEIQNIILNRF